MSKPRICEILGVEVNEEFRYNDHDPKLYYRIDENGHVQWKEHTEWKELAHQFRLEQMIEKGITKHCSIDEQQYSYLKFLHELFYAEILDREISTRKGLYVLSMQFLDGSRERIHIPEGSCLDNLFEKSLVPIYISKLLDRYEEAHNV